MGNAACLTVCVCTHNRPDCLAACLAGLASQTLRADTFEILVIDSGSTPENAMALRRHVAGVANARSLRIDEPGLCRARNLGAREARADYIAYIDDDAVPEPGWAQSILDAIERRGILVCCPVAFCRHGRSPCLTWWPERLRGVLSINEAEGRGPFGSPDLPQRLEPCGANLIVHVSSLLTLGGFWTQGRCGNTLLSDDEVQLCHAHARGWAVDVV